MANYGTYNISNGTITSGASWSTYTSAASQAVLVDLKKEIDIANEKELTHGEKFKKWLESHRPK